MYDAQMKAVVTELPGMIMCGRRERKKEGQMGKNG